MEIIGFIIFFAFSHFGAMQVFRLTTYHKHFWPSLPLLIGYAALVAWLLFTLEMHSFFLWQLFLAAVCLILVGKSQGKSMRRMLELAGGNADEVRFMASSAAKTNAYYTISSIVYLVVFAAVYLWLYNGAIHQTL